MNQKDFIDLLALTGHKSLPGPYRSRLFSAGTGKNPNSSSLSKGKHQKSTNWQVPL